MHAGPRVAAAPTTIVVHSGPGALEAARGAWLHVCDLMADPVAFARHSWAHAWRSVYGGSHDVLVLEVRRGPDAIGIAPFQVAAMPSALVRRIEFIGGGPPNLAQWALNPDHLGHGFFNDILAVPGEESNVFGAVGGWLADHPRLWDEVRLTCVPDLSPISDLVARLPRGARCTRRAQEKMFLDTSLGWDAFRERLGQRQRRHLRYEPKALARAAGADLELEQARGPEVPAAIERFIELIQHRWGALEKPAVTDGDVALYRALARREELGVVVHTLSAAGRTLAMQFGFDGGGRYIPFAFAFDPSLERTSPAQVLMQLVIQRCCEDGHREVDLAALRSVGQWAGHARTRVHICIRSPRRVSRLRTATVDAAARLLTASQQTSTGQRARALAARQLFRLRRRRR